MSPHSLTRKAFCHLAAGAVLGFVSSPRIRGETLLRYDHELLSPRNPETVLPSPAPAENVPAKTDLDRLIDTTNLQAERWQHIILHHSASTQGNAAIFDLYHRSIKKMSNGLAYHFVIGNGTNSQDGEIEISRRWQLQIQGGHVKDSWYNSNSIGICLVGNFENTPPSTNQIKALTGLLDHLKNNLLQGKPRVFLHRDIQKTLCPGQFFPEDTIRTLFG